MPMNFCQKGIKKAPRMHSRGFFLEKGSNLPTGRQVEKA
jgi:hypothetical protein